MDDYIYIGRVANTHGVRGAIKVFPTTDDINRFELLKKVFIEDSRKNIKEYTITDVKYLKQLVVLQFKEITTMDEAMALKQGIVMIHKKDALPLEEDEYYISDLIGIMAEDDLGNPLGKIIDILPTGSNDVYVIDNGTKHGLLVPAIKDCILKVDVKEKLMIIHLLEGLVD